MVITNMRFRAVTFHDHTLTDKTPNTQWEAECPFTRKHQFRYRTSVILTVLFLCNMWTGYGILFLVPDMMSHGYCSMSEWFDVIYITENGCINYTRVRIFNCLNASWWVWHCSKVVAPNVSVFLPEINYCVDDWNKRYCGR